MSVNVDRLNEGQVITILVRVSEAMVNEVSKPMVDHSDPVLRLHWRQSIEDIRRRALHGFTQGVLLGCNRVDEKVSDEVKGDMETELKRATVMGGDVNPDEFPRRIILGHTDRFLYRTYVLRGLEVGRGAAPLEVRVPFGGAQLDLTLPTRRQPLAVNGDQTSNG